MSYQQFAHDAAMGNKEAMETFEMEAPSELLKAHNGDVQAAAAAVADDLRKQQGGEGKAKAPPAPKPAAKPASEKTTTTVRGTDRLGYEWEAEAPYGGKEYRHPRPEGPLTEEGAAEVTSRSAHQEMARVGALAKRTEEDLAMLKEWQPVGEGKATRPLDVTDAYRSDKGRWEDTYGADGMDKELVNATRRPEWYYALDQNPDLVRAALDQGLITPELAAVFQKRQDQRALDDEDLSMPAPKTELIPYEGGVPMGPEGPSAAPAKPTDSTGLIGGPPSGKPAPAKEAPKAAPKAAPTAKPAPVTGPAAAQRPSDSTGMVGFPPSGNAPGKPAPGNTTTSTANVAKIMKEEPSRGADLKGLATLAKMNEGPLDPGDLAPEVLDKLTASEAEDLLIENVISKATYDAVLQKAMVRARTSASSSGKA